MTDAEIDALWAEALYKEIKEGKPVTRYCFARLVAERAAAPYKDDAERYRLLRQCVDDAGVLELLSTIDADPETPEEFDAAIDQAIRQRGAK